MTQQGREAVIVEAVRTPIGRGLTRILDHIAVGCDPVRMLEGPIPATNRLLARNRMTSSDIDYGSRLLTTLLHVLEDANAEVGLATMCCGGGLGTGTLIQGV